MPSKVFLDEPYPANLPEVDVCAPCNQSFSLDEEYLACLLECAACGSTDPEKLVRPKVQRILAKAAPLRSRLELAKREADTHGGEKLVVWTPEDARVRNVILKLARGHALFELNEPMLDEPDHLSFVPIHLMSNDDRRRFENSPMEEPFAVWPEVGSRAMQRLITGEDLAAGWVVVQENRYRYQAVAGGFVSVKIVLRDYLAAEAIWNG
jgi:hypothetical protein